MKLNLPQGWENMDKNSQRQLLEIALTQALEDLQKSVLELAGQVAAQVKEINTLKLENGKQALAIESLKTPRLKVEVKPPEIKVDTKGIVSWIWSKVWGRK